MAEENPNKRIVEVEFNQQQEVIIRRLKEDGKYGKTDAEIIRAALREFLQQTRI